MNNRASTILKCLQYNAFALRLILIPVFALFSICKLISQDDALRSEILKLIKYETELKLKDHPGFIIGILDQDSSYYRSFGQAESSLNQHSIFEIGSVSKVFTSLLIGELIQTGDISLKSKVQDFIPSKFHNDQLAHLVVEDLLNHTSGLPKRPKGFGKYELNADDPYGVYTHFHLLDAYHKQSSVKSGTFRYSHMNYALLQWIIEKATGTSYELALEERLWSKLGFEKSHIENTDLTVTQGYNRAMNPVRPWTFPSFAGSEGIKSNAKELLRFAQYAIRCYEKNNAQDYCSLSMKATTDTNLGNHIDIGLGWYVIDQKKRSNIIMHSGHTSGHYAMLMLMPETKTAVVALSKNNEGVQNLAYELLRMINNNWKRKPIS